MDIQDSSISRSSEVRIDVSSEDSEEAIDQASQHGNQSEIEEVRVDTSSKGSATNEACQNSPTPTNDSEVVEDMLEVEVNGHYRPLFEAAVKGDWKAAKEILNKDPKATTAEVMTVKGKSIVVLEVAIMAAQDQFVENLVKCLPQEYDVGIFKRALNKAAKRGRIRMVKALLDKVHARPKSVIVPLAHAAFHAPMPKETVWYLARRTTSAPHFKIMRGLIVAGHMDICLYLVRRWPNLVSSVLNEDGRYLEGLAKLKSYFHSGSRLSFWEKCIYQCIPLCLVDKSFDISNDTKMARGVQPALMQFKISLWNLATKLAPIIKRTGESKLRHTCSLEFANRVLPEKTEMKSPKVLQYISAVVHEATSHGIFEIVELCLRKFPELMWDEDFTLELMKKVVLGRHVELFRLVNGHLTTLIWMQEDLVMQMTEGLPTCVHTDVSGAAFIMQRELQWFEVLRERSFDSCFGTSWIDHPSTKERGKASWEDFVKKHDDLLKLAGQWMKDTSSSCSLVSTLIITVAFAAAFTIPGGNDSMRGIPIFLKTGSFMVFAIADALALFSSITATLMFLAILTSRYAIEDFLRSLPRKMVLGLTFLFLSLGFMLVAFSSALMIVLSERLKWIYIPITLMPAIPTVLFAILQLPLYVEMVQSTFWPRLYRPLKIWR